MQMSRQTLAKIIDYSLLKPDAAAKDIKRLCSEAVKYSFYSVCVNPCYVALAKKLLKNSGIKAVAAIAFPTGEMLSEVKIFEAEQCIKAGADELDMVMNIGAFKSKNYRLVKEDIHGVVKAAEERIVKVIIETPLLNKREIATASRLVKKSGAHFVKSCTSYTGVAKAEDIAIIRKTVGSRFGVKASGGISTFEKAVEMINAGANRIGTSSAVKIIREIEE